MKKSLTTPRFSLAMETILSANSWNILTLRISLALLKLLLLTFFPKPIKSISSLTITNIDNPACIKINDNSLVNMTFLYGKLVNTNVPNTFKRRWTVVTFEIDGMNLLYVSHVTFKWLATSFNVMPRRRSTTYLAKRWV